MISHLTNDEKKTAIELLQRSVQLEELEQVISDLNLYLWFQDELSSDADNRKTSLAEVVLLVLGDNLLKNAHIREALNRLTDEPLKNWKSGASETLRFCERLGISEQFAGYEQNIRTQPAEFFTPQIQSLKLQDYQEELVSECISHFDNGKSVLLSLPTGAGKTLTAAEILFRDHESLPGTSTIWLAHTEELCEQAVQSLIGLWEQRGSQPLLVLRAWGNNASKLRSGHRYFQEYEGSVSDSATRIIVTTPQSALKLNTDLNGTLSRTLNRLTTIVTDEAHRAGADTYRKIYQRYTQRYGELKLLGLSATPIRETYGTRPYEGTETLATLFDVLLEPTKSLAGNDPVLELERRGVLAKLVFHQLLDRSHKSSAVAEKIIEVLNAEPNRTSLMFTRTVPEAIKYSTIFNQHGYRSEYVSANSSTNERLSVINLLKRNEIDILCNCEILTTGFDAPNIDRIFLARSTKSPVLYKQIVGRGLRGPLFGGSEICDVYGLGEPLEFDSNPNTSEFARKVWSNVN
jgi:DNA repair protein RadD